MRSWFQVLETASCRNAEKGSVHKIQSGWTLHKRELRVLGCPVMDAYVGLPPVLVHKQGIKRSGIRLSPGLC
jgi:hypothetical protein